MSESQSINLTELIEATAKKVADKFESKLTPPAQPTALTETVSKPVEDWRVKACEVIKDLGMKGEMHWTPKSWAKEDIAQENKTFTETIGALSGGSAVPDIWSTQLQILSPYPASAFLSNPAVVWHQDISGKAGDSINVITVQAPVAGTNGCAEANGTAPTVSCKNISLTDWSCELSMCKTDVEDMVPEAVDALNDALIRCIDTGIDNYIVGEMSPVCQGTVNTGTLGMIPGYIADCIGSMRLGTEEPIAGIMHPIVEAQLMQDSQFVNAATFGDRSVVTGGHITNYLGIPFVVVPAGSLFPAGTMCETYLLAKGGVHAVMKRPPAIESQYLVQTKKKYVSASVRLGAAVVDKAGVWKIRTGLSLA